MSRYFFFKLVRWTGFAIGSLFVIGVAAFGIAYWRSDNDCADLARTVPVRPMKAVVHCEYGSADVLRVASIETPVPAEGRVLVRVRAASVNPVDMHYMLGTPYIMRLDGGLRKPTGIQLGVDFAGTVEAVGPNVTQFKPGDAVFGARTGAFAEYVSARQTMVVAKPETMSFEQAAAVPVAGLTALQAIRDKARIQRGQRVLINGASGGVGTFAVQIAKALGANVTGVCSTRNVEMVRSLGADEVIDYTREDYTKGTEPYDAIIDMVGNHSLSAHKDILKENGTYVVVGGRKGRWIAPVDRFARAVMLSKLGSRTFIPFISELRQDDLMLLKDMMEKGVVRPVIDRRYSLDQIADAMRHLQTGRARGKIVVTVAQ